MGTTPAPRTPDGGRAVHPHACGDNDGTVSRGGGDAVHPHACGDNPGHEPGSRQRHRFTPTRVGTTWLCPRSRCRPTVHPHACGDNCPYSNGRNAHIGSPPRVWGQPRLRARQTVGGRFTPTRVGTTRRPAPPASPSPVHPHACGDNGSGGSATFYTDGSPPRVWGQLPPEPREHVNSRFTPTRVGTTQVRDDVAPQNAVHPHACGDNSRTRNCHRLRCGSPPRVWGQRAPRQPRAPRQRFTPTRVGTTRSPGAGSTAGSVHPHACGDNGQLGRQLVLAAGSPPRVWGQPRQVAVNRPVCRFTPTRVGTTPALAEEYSLLAVHPHACGDNANSFGSQCPSIGSPPRVWGQLKRCFAAFRAVRFTPTRVGTTDASAQQRSVVAVHPHACGDNSCCTCSAAAITGSPPRVWGQRLHEMFDCVVPRFTPTRVGTTVS